MGNLLGLNANEDVLTSKRSLSKKRRSREWEAEEKVVSCSYSSKRKRARSTSNYIYNALFVEGDNSDITIRALDHEWKLHKIYLRQAKYFNGMFQGSWKESSLKVIDLQIPDKNINKEALKTAFGSLYSDDLEILPSQVVSVLAAASLIQLECLMEHCTQVMLDAVCTQNVCCFYKEAKVYGQPEVEKACLKWLASNLMLQTKNPDFLMEIDELLMQRIIASDELFVLQVEMDVYTMLKMWLFLKISSSEQKKLLLAKSDKDRSVTIKAHFANEYHKTGEAFLLSEKGLKYTQVFQAVRFCNIMRDFGCCIELEKDAIVPKSWLTPLYRDRWLTMLRVEQGVDTGPGQTASLDKDSLRCGRVLLRDTDHCWRWNGYNFGLDLLVTYNSQPIKTLCLKRNVHSQRRVASAGMSVYRKIIYQIKLFSLDENGKMNGALSVGPRRLSLEKDEEKAVVTFENSAVNKPTFPLMVSASFRVVSGHDMGNSSYTINPSMTSTQSDDNHKGFAN